MTATKPKRRRPWRTIGCLLFGLLAVGAVAAIVIARTQLVRQPEQSGELLPIIVPVERGPLNETVQVNGSLEPADQSRVSFPEGARVEEVLVAEGEAVTTGQVLARLETRDLELKVASAQARLDQAQQALDKLQAGPTRAELLAAEAQVARARAAITAAGAEVRAIDIELARARLDAAREALAALDSGELPPDVRAAEEQLIGAQDALVASRESLENTRDNASRAKTQAEQSMQRGVQDLAAVQRRYSDAFWDWDFVQRTGRHPREQVPDADGQLVNRELEPHEIEQFKRTLDDAKVELGNTELALKNLQEAYDQAREDEVRQVQAAERAVTAAERDVAEAAQSYDRQRGRGVAAARLEARADVAEAEKAYKELVDDPERPARQIELEAALLEALAAQEKLTAGPEGVELAQARTALEEARAELAEAEANLDAATLRAPIAGTVVDVTIKPGTRTTSEDSIRIADIGRFLIRGQVTEQNVAQVRVGQTVQVNVDSVAGESFSGELTRVSELPEDTSGGDSFAQPGFGMPGTPLGGLYPIEIVLAAGDNRLRVGMAATAEIAILAIEDALIIPLQAVSEGPDGPIVQRVIGEPGPDGQPLTEEVPIELGPTSGDRIQVLSGLEEGDSLLLPQMPPMEQPQFGPGI